MVDSIQNAYKGKKVLVTGHTGFKGSWLCLWLKQLGAEVSGYALAPEECSLFNDLNLQDLLANHCYHDISELSTLREFYKKVDPDYVFHLAAQPLVRYSYREPVETFRTNILGTVNLLDCLREAGKQTSVVIVTTDKCYSNQEWLYSYRENEPMGGHDPYSASKGAAELVVSSYRDSYFSGVDSLVTISSARAGNVIGGGDWAEDRIIPDCVRALEIKEPVSVRNRIATRPWQHVLEPLSGYLHLAQTLYQKENLRSPLFEHTNGFNFGPQLQSNRTVEQLVVELLKHIEGSWEDASDPEALHEASKLNLAIDKAFHLLDWLPVWSFDKTVKQTADWYKQEQKKGSKREFTIQQIKQYTTDAQAMRLPWAK